MKMRLSSDFFLSRGEIHYNILYNELFRFTRYYIHLEKTILIHTRQKYLYTLIIVHRRLFNLKLYQD